MRLARGIRSTAIGIAANLALAFVKAAAGVFGNSYALIADAVESLADTFTSLVVLAGLRLASAPPDENHPYGHGKAEPLAATVVSIGLFLAAAAITISSIREIVTPHHAPAPFTLLVLIAVIVVKEGLFRYVDSAGADVSSTAIRSDAWHHRSDALTSAAAFIGISIALIGGPGYESADDWAALLASGVIAYNAFRLLRPALYELTDAAAPREVIDQVRAIALTVDGVKGTHKCHLRKMGVDYVVDLDVLVEGELTVREGHEIAHRVQDALRQADPMFARALIHIEPV